jgi:hypothetical protein
MHVKIKLPKRFYTVEQLAERWECPIDDVRHLTENGLLKTADKGAARVGKRYLMARIVDDWDLFYEQEELGVLGVLKAERTIPVGNTSSHLTDEELIKKEMESLVDAGEFDQVILVDDVYQFERDHGEPTEETAPPSLWPWGDYDTPLLRILAEAVNHFCVNSTEGYPGKECGEVINWIKCRMRDNGMSPSHQLAGSIETLIAPRPYVHHRQRKHK